MSPSPGSEINNGSISGKLVRPFCFLETASKVQFETVLNRCIFEWLKKQGKTARRQGKRRAWQGNVQKAGHDRAPCQKQGSLAAMIWGHGQFGPSKSEDYCII